MICRYYLKCIFQHGLLSTIRSKTCNRGGGDYCGKWRELKEKENNVKHKNYLFDDFGIRHDTNTSNWIRK